MCSEQCIGCLSRWRLWIRPLFIFVYAFAALVFVPYFLVKSLEDGFNKHDQEILIGGVFVLVAIPLSFWEMIQHGINYTEPRLQKHIIRILWMVPIYAVNAWLGLIYPRQSVYVDCLRECYEAYVIYNFMKFLLNYLNMEMDLEANLELKPQVKHMFPLCCLPQWEMGREFVHICKHGILQYTVVRPLTTAISFICKSFDVFGDGQFKANVAFPYMIAINNLSQFIAMYCLIMFYRATLSELKPMKPLGKFLCIKAVVFFSFFQGVLISLMVYLEWIKPSPDTGDDPLSLSIRLQNFLICIEMCLAAIAHHYSFSYKEYISRGSRNQSCCSAFLAMWDVSDVQSDIREHLGIVGSSISRRLRGRSMYTIPRGNNEFDPLVALAVHGAPSLPNYYQSNCDELIVNYGTVSASQPIKMNRNRYDT
ncbi:LOW QUALITY PROTEIN: transmembrane protein 184C [Leptinotarsa decemlineata]|uniref:LOW QUALITY PROTEIN: transmembrane protein 184C n=1 Tax=Leptinotarsa decemlineata TaxID=7539 RepID=UPI003D305D44